MARTLAFAALAAVLCCLGVEAIRDPSTLGGQMAPESNEDDWRTKPVIVPPSGRQKELILSMDGGGLRGILTVEVLIEVELQIKKAVQARRREWLDLGEGRGSWEYALRPLTSIASFEIDLADYFVAIAGVGSGSWIATYLASKGGNGASARVFGDRRIQAKYGDIRPGSVTGLRVMFMEYGPSMFPPSFPFTITPKWFGLPTVAVPTFTAPSFTADGVENMLDDFLGDCKLFEAKTDLFVQVYDLERRAAAMFSRAHQSGISSTATYLYEVTTKPRPPTDTKWQTVVKKVEGKEFLLKDIARASSATPTYFEAKRFTASNDISFEFYAVDGGIMSNNPSFQTLILESNALEVGILESLALMSIGTGVSVGSYDKHADSGAWGYLIATQDLIAIIFDSGSELIQTQLDRFFYQSLRLSQRSAGVEPGQGQYLRIQTAYDRETTKGQTLNGISSPDKLPGLQEIGKELADLYRPSIRAFVNDYLFRLKDTAE